LLSKETPDTQARAGVVIVSWNVRDLLLACVRSLQLSDAPCRIVVVDNASSDGSEAAVRSAFPTVEWIQNDSNTGFTRANNQGLRHLGVIDAPDYRASPDNRGRPDSRRERAAPFPGAGGRALPTRPGFDGAGVPAAVLLLNPDAEVAPDAVSLMLRCLDEHPRAGVVGPALLWPDGSPQSSRRRFPTIATGLFESTPLEWHWPSNKWAARYRMAGVPDEPGEVDWLSGAALMLRTDALRATGAFDERFFMYSEETDLCRRIATAGWEVRYVPSARVMHHEGQSSAQNVAARHTNFHRARVAYFRKHHGRLAAATVRFGVLAEFALELVVEACKLVARSKPDLRRERIAMYRKVLSDGLGPTASVDPIVAGPPRAQLPTATGS
jgi:GT2 family glycosyltransferase